MAKFLKSLRRWWRLGRLAGVLYPTRMLVVVGEGHLEEAVAVDLDGVIVALLYLHHPRIQLYLGVKTHPYVAAHLANNCARIASTRVAGIVEWDSQSGAPKPRTTLTVVKPQEDK